MSATTETSSPAEVLGPVEGRTAEILTPEALAFVAELHRRFDAERRRLLSARMERQERLDAGERPDFLEETRELRQSDWQVAPAPPELQDRRVEITGPVDRKMVINALNSGARVFMADFEDANSPTWANNVEGQVNLGDANAGSISLDTGEKTYELGDDPAVLLVRPRGWHLVERHVLVDGEPVSGSLFDFGLYVFHNRERPWFYIPKLESHLEARLWNHVFDFAEDALGLERGTIKCTVLIETILAAFEMDEILFELREHIVGLNAGRWDYLFSLIKRLRSLGVVLPDRGQLTMTTPFMRAYTELLVQTTHRRGAHAMGGMAAFIPSRRDAEVNDRALAKVREDKVREAGDGFDGTWVAHPDLVPVALEVFDGVLGDSPNQVARRRDDVSVSADELIDLRVEGGAVTEEGLRQNVSVGIRYLESWLRGVGAAAIDNLMEDAATAEISRSQVWQWVHAGRFTADEVRAAIAAEGFDKAPTRRRRSEAVPASPVQPDSFGRFAEATEIFERVALGDDFVEFLTLSAYDYID